MYSQVTGHFQSEVGAMKIAVTKSQNEAYGAPYYSRKSYRISLSRQIYCILVATYLMNVFSSHRTFPIRSRSDENRNDGGAKWHKW
jgi:hypothetical protein